MLRVVLGLSPQKSARNCGKMRRYVVAVMFVALAVGVSVPLGQAAGR